MREHLFSDLPDGMAEAALDRAALAQHEAAKREGQGEGGTDGRAEADVLMKLLSIVAGDRSISRKTEHMIGRRLLLLLWLIRPDAMVGHVGHPLSLRDLAKLLEVSPAALTATLAELQRETELENCFTRAHGGLRRAGRRKGVEA